MAKEINLNLTISLTDEQVGQLCNCIAHLVPSLDEQEPPKAAFPENVRTTTVRRGDASVRVTDEELLEAKGKAVDRCRQSAISPAAIRAGILPKYGISKVTDCPEDLRAELLEELESFASLL